MTLEYTIDLDYETWIPVPLDFPWNGYDTALSWGNDLASDLLAGRNAPEEIRSALAMTAVERALMNPPLEGAVERFWRRPDTGAPDRLAHLYALQTDTLDEDELVELARTGLGGFVQSVTRLDDTEFSVALRVILLLELPQETVSVARLVGVRDDTALLLELIDDNIASFAFIEPDLERLFRSIRLRTV